MTDQPQQQTPNWLILIVVVALVGWVLAGFFGYSLKQTKEKQTSQTTVHSQGVTIYKWQEVAGKAYPVTEFASTSDSSRTTDKEKTVTVWKSGVSLGVAVSTKGDRAGTVQADIIPLGPGTVQVQALVATDEQWAGVAYRFLF